MGLLSTTFCLAHIVMALGGALLALADTRLALVAGALFAAGAAFSLRRWSRQAMPIHQEFA